MTEITNHGSTDDLEENIFKVARAFRLFIKENMIRNPENIIIEESARAVADFGH